MKKLLSILLITGTLLVSGQTKIKYSQMENPSTSSVNFGVQTFSAGNSTFSNVIAKGTMSVVGTETNAGLSIGGGALSGVGNLRINQNMTGAASIYNLYMDSQAQSDVTTTAVWFQTSASTASTGGSYTIPDIQHFGATQGTFGSGSTVTNQWGFVANNMIGASTINAGFRGRMGVASGRWNLYMDGSAQNYLLGSVGINTTTPAEKLHVAGNGLFTGSVTAVNLVSSGSSSVGTNLVASGTFSAGGTATTGAIATTSYVTINNNGTFASTPAGSMYKTSGTGLSFVGVAGSSQDMAFFNPAGTGVFKLPTGTANMHLAESGSVSIGANTTPSYALHVFGNTGTKHLAGTSTAPTIARGTGLGTGAGTVVSVTNATDLSGIIGVVTGTASLGTSAVLATVTFNAAYGTAPNLQLTPANLAAADLVIGANVFPSSSTTTLNINTNTVALTASTTYSWFYHILQ